MPIEIGLPRRLRAKRRPPPTQETHFRSAQADRRPEAPRGRIHSTPKAFLVSLDHCLNWLYNCGRI
jgi:hypothetical protein